MKNKKDRSTIPPVRIRLDDDYKKRLKSAAAGSENRGDSNMAETIVRQWLDGYLINLSEARDMLLKILVDKMHYEKVLIPKRRGEENTSKKKYPTPIRYGMNKGLLMWRDLINLLWFEAVRDAGSWDYWMTQK